MISQINFSVGDLVKVYQRVIEGEKTRTQVFEGTVLAIKGRGDNKTFTVRKKVGTISVEKIFPVLSPNIEKTVVKSHPKKRVRKAKLYHLRHTQN